MSIIPILLLEQTAPGDWLDFFNVSLATALLDRVGSNSPNKSVDPGGSIPSNLRFSSYPFCPGFNVRTRSYT